MRLKLGRRASRNIPVEYFILDDPRSEGAVIGHLAGEPISERVVDRGGSRYRFVGVAPHAADGRFDVDSLRTGEWIVKPGLVYMLDR